MKKIINRFHYLISFLAGTLVFLAFEPFNLTPLASLAPAVLFYLLLQAETRKQHITLAWLFGLGMFITGVHWIFYSIHFFGHAHWLVAAVMTFLFALLVSSVFVVLGFLTSLVRDKSDATKLLLLFPAAWVLIEWFKTWFLTGFPWLMLGQSQIDTWLANISPITGVLGVSWLNVLLAGSFVLLLIGSKHKRLLAAGLSAFILIGSFALGFIHWTSPMGEAITVSLLQGNIAQEDKWKPEHKQPTLDLYQKMTEKSWDSDLIIWPETAIPDWFGQVSEQVIEPLRAAAVVEKSDLLVGGFFYNFETESTYNSIMAITASGEVDIYSKHHRVPFSEYIPFLEYFRFLEKWILLPYDSVGKGEGKTTLNVAKQTAQMSVCYEDAYGEETIVGLPNATMLINLSNDGWFTGSIEPMQHMQIARMRALETGRYLLRSTNTGISGIVNEKGQVIATVDPYVTTIIKGTAQGFSGATPYVKWGNWLIIPMMFAIFGLSGFIRRNYKN